MRIGVCTTDFERAMPADELFRTVKELGFCSVQLAFSSVSECAFAVSDHIEIPYSVSDEAVAAIRAAAAKYSINICAVNGTFNMAHPNPAVRAEGIARFDGFLRAVKAIGCPMATLCSGSRSLTGLWTYDPATSDESAYADMLACMRDVVAVAEKYEIILAIETEAANVVSTPEIARRVLDDVASPNLKMILDAANLFHRGQAHPANVRPALDKAVKYFGSDIVIAHGKDIREGDAIDFCGTGFGIVDFPYMLKSLKNIGFAGDMMLHGIYNISDMPGCLEFMRKCFENSGITETI